MFVLLTLHPKGGGGTDYRPVTAYVEEQGLNPACLVYLTDGCCDRYPEEPWYPVLWIGTCEFNPPFGEFVML